MRCNSQYQVVPYYIRRIPEIPGIPLSAPVYMAAEIIKPNTGESEQTGVGQRCQVDMTQGQDLDTPCKSPGIQISDRGVPYRGGAACNATLPHVPCLYAYGSGQMSRKKGKKGCLIECPLDHKGLKIRPQTTQEHNCPLGNLTWRCCALAAIALLAKSSTFVDPGTLDY